MPTGSLHGQYVENLDRLILGMPRELQRLNGHNKQSFLLVVEREPSDQDALSFQDKDLDTRVFSPLPPRHVGVQRQCRCQPLSQELNVKRPPMRRGCQRTLCGRRAS